MSTNLNDTFIILAGFAVFTAIFLFCIKSFRQLRKKNPTHPLVKLSNTANKKVEYKCTCGKGGTIYLGRAVVRWMDLVIITLIFSIFFLDLKEALTTIREALPALLFLLIVCLCVYIPLYISLYREMREYMHSEECSKNAAIRALPYQMQGSKFEVYK